MLNTDHIYARYYKSFLDRLMSDPEFLKTFRETYSAEEAAVDGPFNGSLSMSIEYNHPATEIMLSVLDFPEHLSFREKIALYQLRMNQ